MDDLDDKAMKLKVLWKSGRDKYVSFFAVLDEVRREIGDEALPQWCIDRLRIGISTISNTKQVLIKADADIVKRTLAEAQAVDRATRTAERERARQSREAERVAREIEKQAHDKQIAEARTEAERAKAEAERAKAETQKERKANQKKKIADASKQERKQRKRIATIPDVDLPELVRRFRTAEAQCQEGESQWVEGSIAIALILHAARAKMPGNPQFGAWLDANNIYPGIDNRNTRTALIGLGGFGEARLREILTKTDSHSYVGIWDKNRVIENPLSQRCDNAEAGA